MTIQSENNQRSQSVANTLHWREDYHAANVYFLGDLTRFGGTIWRLKAGQVQDTPPPSDPTEVSSVWEAFGSGIGVDTDDALAANSDEKVSSQKAVKTYIDAAILAVVGDEIPVSVLDTDGTLAANSDARIATQKAVKTYANAAQAAAQAASVPASGAHHIGFVQLGSEAYGISITSSLASPDSASNLVHIETTDTSWDRPLLRIIDVSTGGAAANIRIDSPNPDIELVETDQVAPAGKFEIAVNGNRLQLNSRDDANTAFETIMEFSQRRLTTSSATINADTTSATRDLLTLLNATSSAGARPGLAWRADGAAYYMARISAQQGASSTNSKFWIQVADAAKALQDRLSIDVNGVVQSITGGFQFPDGNTATAFSADGTLAGNSDSTIATQKAVKTYVDQIIAAQDAMVFKGVTDCSANPNFPAGNRGDTYRVSVAGKIGGASGTNVEAGDLFICLDDSTSSGTLAAQGTHWTIAQTNLDGAVIGPASVTGDNFAQFDGTTGKLIKGGVSLDTNTALGTSDVKVPSQQAVKSYADTALALKLAIASDLSDLHSAVTACKNLGTWRVVGASGAAVSIAATTSASETVLATIAIPAGMMGPNGVIRVTTCWTLTNGGGGNKVPRVRFGASGAGTGGQQFYGTTQTTNLTHRNQVEIHNRNAEASQVGFVNSANSFSATTTSVLITTAINSALATEIAITGTAPVSGDVVQLDSYLVEVYYGA